MNQSNHTVETKCLLCGATLVWTALFCRQAPKGFDFFSCSRHQIAQNIERSHTSPQAGDQSA